MDEKKYKLICVRKGKTNQARTNNQKNVTLGSNTNYTHSGEYTAFLYRTMFSAFGWAGCC